MARWPAVWFDRGVVHAGNQEYSRDHPSLCSGNTRRPRPVRSTVTGRFTGMICCAFRSVARAGDARWNCSGSWRAGGFAAPGRRGDGDFWRAANPATPRERSEFHGREQGS